MSTINLQSSDGVVFKVDIKAAQVSETIKTMVQNLGLEEECEDIVPLPNVNAKTLKKILEWATYHKDDDIPEDFYDNSENRIDDIPNWDVEFLKVETNFLFEILTAANYLDIRGLFQNCCKTVAKMIRGKTSEEIKTTFNIQSDLTQEEIDNIRRENRWCEEK